MFEFAWPLVLALVEFCFKVHIHLWLLFHWLHVACQGVSNASVESIYVCCGIHLCSAYTIESSFELKIVHRIMNAEIYVTSCLAPSSCGFGCVLE